MQNRTKLYAKRGKKGKEGEKTKRRKFVPVADARIDLIRKYVLEPMIEKEKAEKKRKEEEAKKSD